MLKMTEKIDEDTRQALLKGQAWYERHQEFVDRKLTRGNYRGQWEPGVKPSGSDLHRPELWLDFHWRWFFKEKAKWLP